MEKQKMEMKKYFLFPAVVAAVLVLSGCGESLSEKATEKAVEKMIESQGDKDTEVDIDDGKMVVETDEGKMESGEDVALPADFPADVYVVEGKIKAAISDKASEGHTISIETDKSVEDVIAIYKEKFASDGWKITGTMNFGDSATVAAEKDERSASVMIGKSEAATSVILTATKK